MSRPAQHTLIIEDVSGIWASWLGFEFGQVRIGRADSRAVLLLLGLGYELSDL